jgi:uncharacterized protein (DUF1330 family)
MSEKVLVVISGNVNPDGKEALGAYAQKANPMTVKAGGVVQFYEILGHIAGNTNPQMFAIVEFPNGAAVHSLYDSEEYKALIPDRDKGLTNLNIYVMKPKI